MTLVYQRRYRGRARAVLLDWAGTTMDFGCVSPAVVFVKVFERSGVPITMEEARAPMGARKRVHIQKITELDTGCRARITRADRSETPVWDAVVAVLRAPALLEAKLDGAREVEIRSEVEHLHAPRRARGAAATHPALQFVSLLRTHYQRRFRSARSHRRFSLYRRTPRCAI